MRILTLSTAWEGHSGGVTVNRELSIALAELGHDVTARVSVPSPRHPQVRVQGLDRVPGVTDERGQLLRADGLPRNIDVIVGHGRFTGGPSLICAGRVPPIAASRRRAGRARPSHSPRPYSHGALHRAPIPGPPPPAARARRSPRVRAAFRGGEGQRLRRRPHVRRPVEARGHANTRTRGPADTRNGRGTRSTSRRRPTGRARWCWTSRRRWDGDAVAAGVPVTRTDRSPG
jgi:hypothetical protein